MTAEEIVEARRRVGLPSHMRVRHEKFGVADVWAYCRTQAEIAACLQFKCNWADEQKRLHISVMKDQSGYEPLLAGGQ